MHGFSNLACYSWTLNVCNSMNNESVSPERYNPREFCQGA